MIAVIVASLMLVLALASSAWAECAWVLWQKTDDVRTSAALWNLIEATSLERDCRRMALQTAAATRKALGNLQYTVTPSSDPAIFSAAKGDSVDVHAFKCLPDTIDPRGAKGK